MKQITTDLSMQNLKTSEHAQDLTRPLKVWSQLAEMFGSAFLRENADEPPKLWVQAISRLSDDQIGFGLATLGNQGLSFPPNLSQFIFACKKTKPAAWGLKLPQPASAEEASENADKAWKHMELLAGRPLKRL